MKTFENDKGEEVVIAEMDNWRLVHSITKYAGIASINEPLKEKYEEVVKVLKAEAVRRMEVKVESAGN